MDYLSTRALSSHPERFWKYFAAVFGPVGEAPPNHGHRVLARLEHQGYLAGVATQNIDGLHQKAGSRTVYELHGHLRTIRCETCEARFPMQTALEQVAREKLPLCPQCEARLRPDVVLFGDMMPPEFPQALEAARVARALLVVGSSLSVSPANSLAFQVDRLAIINLQPTPADDRAVAVINAPAGETLLALEAEIQRLEKISRKETLQ